MKRPVKNFKEWSRSKSSFNLNESVQFPTNHDEIKQILKDYDIKKYSIRPDGTVDVDENVYLEKYHFEYFPVKFGIVKGDFNCNRCKNLKTLEGAPEECKEFSCYKCKNLKSLEGAPKECEEFDCSYCYELESLEGGPKKCKEFICSGCMSLKTLEGAPKECRKFDCGFCENLESFEGAPEKCENFYCHDCINLKSLEGAPEECEKFVCSYCHGLESLEGAPEKCENFYCHDCINLKSLEGAPEECEIFYCSGCKNLEYSLEHFPKCKEINIKNTCFEELYNTISDDIFIRLVNTDSKSEFEIILAFGHSKGLNFERYIKPLLKDKTMTEETFKHTYRGAVAGERFRF